MASAASLAALSRSSAANVLHFTRAFAAPGTLRSSVLVFCTAQMLAQRAVVDLAVGVKRHLVDPLEPRRDHIVRQHLAELVQHVACDRPADGECDAAERRAAL